MPNGIILTTNGNTARVDYKDLDYQRVVGGMIQAIDFKVEGWDVTMYLNEEGKYMPGCPLNPVATQLVAGLLFEGDYIGGDVVLVGVPDGEGETQSLSDETIRVLMVIIAAARERLVP
jgi:hypothetical protein